MTPKVIPPGAGEILGDSPDRRVEILSDRDELHATWSRFGPGRDGAGRHIHHHHTDFFFVLEGELAVKIEDDDEINAGVGTLVAIPPLVIHGFRNAGDVDVKYLNLHAPGCGFADYMRGLRDHQPVDFDQHDPEGVDGIRPASEIAIGLPYDTGELAVELRTDGSDARASDSVESFYVLEGEISVEVEDGIVHAPAGVWAQLEPGTRFEVSVGGEPARYLALSATPS